MSDIIDVVAEKAKKGIKIRSIFSETAIIPEERKQIFEKHNFKKFIADEVIQRKMKKEVKTAVLLNEKEACVIFPKIDGDTDMSEMFYSEDPLFHEWCQDFFEYYWKNSNAFQESKLIKQ